ncbi:MAG: hypothetical protein SFV24_02840 [Gemmatimonadales bacterium]|nr:hypothetical protein [Gemmatimonadales bacterium]
MTRLGMFSLATALLVAGCSTADSVTGVTPNDLPQMAKGGGGGTTPPVVTILPTTAPAPGILYRESFGSHDGFRPYSSKGELRSAGLHTTIGGFWIEWPGSKNTRWITPDGDQTWKFAGCSPETPGELPSPLQTINGNGCVSSEWFDAVTQFPTALMPFVAPATAYEVSISAWVAPIPNAYIGLGFTNSGVTLGNLATSGAIWIRLRDLDLDGGPLHYELRVNGMTGPVLVEGRLGVSGWDPIALRYDPAAQAVTLRVDGTTIGTYPFSMSTPRYVGFEGVGVLDDFVVRQ